MQVINTLALLSNLDYLEGQVKELEVAIVVALTKNSQLVEGFRLREPNRYEVFSHAFMAVKVAGRSQLNELVKKHNEALAEAAKIDAERIKAFGIEIKQPRLAEYSLESGVLADAVKAGVASARQAIAKRTADEARSEAQEAARSTSETAQSSARLAREAISEAGETAYQKALDAKLAELNQQPATV